MDRFVYIRNGEDDAYMNKVSNFKGMEQSGSAEVLLRFEAAAGAAGNNAGFDLITLSVTDTKEKEAMFAIGGALAGGKSGSTAVIADDHGNVYCDDNVTGVTSITKNTLGNNTVDIELVTVNDTLTSADSGKTFVFNDADGAVLTLPDSGAGDIVGWFADFYINVTATSNAHKVVNADTSNEKMYGVLHNTDTDSSDADVTFAAVDGDGFSAVSCDGSTTGIQGTSFRVTNVAADKWHVTGDILATGSPATSFAAS
tara:strand:- start:42 stop:809 length:768 start_codon:yes stop_codon:yes gene_type:complete